MSGPIVQMRGGPLDGRETHAVTCKRAQEQLFEAGDWSAGSRDVHVYRSVGGRAPFVYQGTRLWVRDVEAVLPLIL